MIIDFHTHLFPDKIAARAIDSLKKGIIKTHGTLLLEPQTDGTLGGLLRAMDQNGVTMSIVMPIATTPTQYESINRFAVEITDNKRIISFGSIHPRQENWEETLEDIYESGLKGIKLHPEFQDFFVDEEITEKIVKKCESLGLWILFHCGEDYGYKPPFRCTPQRLRTLIDKTGGKNIIAAHFGGFSMWEDVDKYLIGTDIYMDTSMTSGFLDKAFCLDMINRHGEDKFLFGSDAPWQSQKVAYDYIKSLEIGERTLEMIKHENAERILKL